MPPKVVVFDLDETLGYFFQLGQLWDLMHFYIEKNKKSMYVKLTQTEFTELLNLFPEYLRPNIFSILKYLKHKKEKRQCNGVMLYTNNQSHRSWATLIVNYLNDKTNFSLFDQIISAFKVNGQRIEICRTTNEKTVDDFIRCTKLPANTEICFLDDVYHPEMTGDNVYYIKLNPYTYNLSQSEMIKRVLNSDLGKRIIGNERTGTDSFETFIVENFNNIHSVHVEKTQEEYEIDKIVSKKTMILLQDFFKKSWNGRTQKVRYRGKGKRVKTTKRRDVIFTDY